MEPIAIIGYACRLPEASDADAFWRLLMEGRSNYGELPPERLNQELYYSPEKGIIGKTYSKVGAVFSLQGKNFRPKHQLLSDCEGQHAAYEVVADAVRNSGYTVGDFPHRQTGVYVATRRTSQVSTDKLLLQDTPVVLEYLKEIGGFAVLPKELQKKIVAATQQRITDKYSYSNRFETERLMYYLTAWNISYALNLDGPTMIMDGACASSLSAVTLASRALNDGSIDCAIAGGS
ncbi:MAG: hypothetical protein LBK82_10255, partial [Planctomycetaceae bacterium]|nr:hypothetical protein [Planctomycetaceae bacterium]